MADGSQKIVLDGFLVETSEDLNDNLTSAWYVVERVASLILRADPRITDRLELSIPCLTSLLQQLVFNIGTTRLHSHSSTALMAMVPSTRR